MVLKTIGTFRSIDWLKLLSYFGLFTALFAIFLYITFPYDSIKDSIVYSMESKYPVKVEIGKITPYRITGFQVQNVSVAKSDEPSKEIFHINKGRIRIHILPLLALKLKADFDLYTFGGGIAGQMEWKKAEVAIAANFKDMDIARAGAQQQLQNYGEIKISGKIDGHFEMYWNNIEKIRSRGLVRLEYRDLTIMNSTLLGNTLPDIIFKDPAVVQLSLTNRFLNIDEWTLASDNLEVAASGRITIRPQFANSLMKVNLKLKLGDAIEDNLGMMAMGLGEQDASGYYNFLVSGAVNSPKFAKR